MPNSPASAPPGLGVRTAVYVFNPNYDEAAMTGRSQCDVRQIRQSLAFFQHTGIELGNIGIPAEVFTVCGSDNYVALDSS